MHLSGILCEYPIFQFSIIFYWDDNQGYIWQILAFRNIEYLFFIIIIIIIE